MEYNNHKENNNHEEDIHEIFEKHSVYNTVDTQYDNNLEHYDEYDSIINDDYNNNNDEHDYEYSEWQHQELEYLNNENIYEQEYDNNKFDGCMIENDNEKECVPLDMDCIYTGDEIEIPINEHDDYTYNSDSSQEKEKVKENIIYDMFISKNNIDKNKIHENKTIENIKIKKIFDSNDDNIDELNSNVNELNNSIKNVYLYSKNSLEFDFYNSCPKDISKLNNINVNFSINKNK